MTESRERRGGEGRPSWQLSWLTAGLCVLSPLLVGGAPPWSLTLASLVSVYLLCVLLWSRRYLRSMWGLLCLGYLVSAFGACISLLTLSQSTLNSIAPLNAELWRGLSELLNDQLGALGAERLSVTPVETYAWLCLQLTSLSAAYVAYHLHRARTPVLIALGALGPLLTVAGLTHAALNLSAIYGLYQSLDRESLTGFVTPVINRNTAASVMLLSALTSLGVGLHRRALAQEGARGGEQAGWWLTAASVSALGLTLCGSRAALIAGVVGGGVMLFRAMRLSGKRLFCALSVTLLGALCAGLSLEWGSLWQLTESTPLRGRSHLADPHAYPRLMVWGDCLAYLKRSWLWGTGRGSFGEVYMSLQSFSARMWISHPENHPLQQLIEGGVIGFLGGVIIPIWAWLRWWRRSLNQAHLSAFGLWVALAAVCVHQLFDFGFEYLGLSVPVAIAWGLLWSYLPAHEEREEALLRSRSRGLRLACACGVGISSLSLGGVQYWQSHQGLRLREAVIEARVSPELGARSLRALAAHPASAHLSLEHLLHQVRASLSISRTHRQEDTSDTRAHLWRWLRHVKRRGPQLSAPYQLEARLLRAEGLDELASLSYARALNQAPWRFKLITEELTKQTLMSPQLLARPLQAPYLRVVQARFGAEQSVALIEASAAWRESLYHAEEQVSSELHALRAAILNACAEVSIESRGASSCLILLRELQAQLRAQRSSQKKQAQGSQHTALSLSRLMLDEQSASCLSDHLSGEAPNRARAMQRGASLMNSHLALFKRRIKRWQLTRDCLESEAPRGP